MTLPVPEHFTGVSDELRLANIDQVMRAAAAYASEHHVPAARTDSNKIAVLAIDCQISLCHPASPVAVPGAMNDMARAIEWMYKNVHKLNALFFSQNSSRVFQIQSPSWWVGEDGRRPEPGTVITANDLANNIWRAAAYPADSRGYIEGLMAAGAAGLVIKPYHSVLGDVGHALVPELLEAAAFHSAVRKTLFYTNLTGGLPTAEGYSAVGNPGPYNPGGYNEQLCRTLMSYDRLYIFGEPFLINVKATLDNLLSYISEHMSGAESKIYVLADATSSYQNPDIDPLPEHLNYAAQREAYLPSLIERGVNFARTTDTISFVANVPSDPATANADA